MLENRIHAVLQNSTVRFADIAAGNADGPQLSIKFSRHDTADSDLLRQAARLDQRRYLTASITKPVVATLAIQAAAEGRLSLNDPVRVFLQGFHRGPLRNITIRHLLTHTSGLPDMLPNNNELRAAHATLAQFVIETALVTPAFSPGTDCRYSSMGFAVLASILERVYARSVAEELQESVFSQIGMQETWLGLPVTRLDELLPTTMPCELPIWQVESSEHWNWNSAYWRSLGAPWGGMISTADDLGKYAAAILTASSAPATSVFTASVIRQCFQNQTMHFSGLSERDRSIRPWGFGWRFNWRDHPASFGDFLSSSTVGHWGATGTLLWIDPENGRWFVMLTTQPWEQSQSAIQRVSNLVASTP